MWASECGLCFSQRGGIILRESITGGSIWRTSICESCGEAARPCLTWLYSYVATFRHILLVAVSKAGGKEKGLHLMMLGWRSSPSQWSKGGERDPRSYVWKIQSATQRIKPYILIKDFRSATETIMFFY